MIVTGWNVGKSTLLNQTVPRVRIDQLRISAPAVNGITMKSITEYNNTINGTVRDDAPAISNPTIGAKRTSIMRSFTDT